MFLSPAFTSGSHRKGKGLYIGGCIFEAWIYYCTFPKVIVFFSTKVLSALQYLDQTEYKMSFIH